ncbi:Polypyrimidine tract-binding protein [Echinococcus granulosus]|uniref:Polypyrimidine tract-binding protein n=1 Tax=Echinococcus granulosus TaxID=6210 RepID=W6UZP0_ECHGR|nr:Polypyrimidine tract-binding protein [Echinococcus granulosus]EUB63992.1 Polypyrimidine tract-binding protein [Echinococcus granulosus]
MFLAPDGVKPFDLSLGCVFGSGLQPGQSDNLLLNRLLYLAATGYGLRKRSFNTTSETLSVSSKRPRVEGMPMASYVLPSRVLHIRGLPADTTEIEIVKLAMPFGPIANFVLTKKTGQALIEMTSVEVAAKMLEYYQFYPPLFRGGEESAILQFSKYQSLELTGISRSVSEAIAMANEHFLHCVAENPTRPRVLRVFLEPTPHNQLNYMDYFKRPKTSWKTKEDITPEQNMYCRRTVGLGDPGMAQRSGHPEEIFYRYGAILRIIVFKMSGRSQAFVEFHSPISAHAALLDSNATAYVSHEFDSLVKSVMTVQRGNQEHFQGTAVLIILGIREVVEKVEGYSDLLLAMGDSNDTEHNLEMVFMALAPRVIPHKALRRGGRFITGVVAKAVNGQVLPLYAATMRIEFSRQTSLELRQDDNTSRDFVAQPLSSQEEQDLIKALTPL